VAFAPRSTTLVRVAMSYPGGMNEIEGNLPAS